MPLPSETPEPVPCYIVNDVDRPAEDHIAVKWGGELYYIHPRLRDDKTFWGMGVDRAVPLENFGIEWKIEGGRFIGSKNKPSVATYRDGGPRNWQGSAAFSFALPGPGAKSPFFMAALGEAVSEPQSDGSPD